MIDVIFVVLAVLLGAALLYYFMQLPQPTKACGSCPKQKNTTQW